MKGLWRSKPEYQVPHQQSEASQQLYNPQGHFVGNSSQQQQQQERQYNMASQQEHFAAPTQPQQQAYEITPQLQQYETLPLQHYPYPQDQQQYQHQHQHQQHHPPPPQAYASPHVEYQNQQQFTSTAVSMMAEEYPLKGSHEGSKIAVEDPAVEPDRELPGPVKVHRRRRLFLWALRYFIVVAVVAVLLSIPLIVYRNGWEVTDEDSLRKARYQQLVYNIFAWLLTSLLGFVFFDLLGLALPYIFRFVARYVNPAHQKYWRFLRVMRRPISVFFGIIICYVAFALYINLNQDLEVNIGKPPGAFYWDDVIDDILEQATLWAGFYLIEKILILYIRIHYHYRGDHTKIVRSKDMLNALMTLYEASLYLHPAHSGAFDEEDMVIRNATGREYATGRKRATTYLSRIGIDSYKLASFFGNFVSDDPKSHWFRPASSYATVERAMANPRSGAALGRRIWMSLTAKGSESMTANDVAEVLGPYHRDEAAAAFKVVDGGETGDVRLDEMVMTVVEAGKLRYDIYESMHYADHCINTFDWVCLFIIAVVMIFFIMVLYVPSLQSIQQTLSFLGIGLGFAAGKAAHHFLIGVIYVFFDHPFDVGDRVEVYNFASTSQTACVVKRISLLYTVFRRVDNGSDMQVQNERLVLKRVENVSRSGANRQALSLYVDFRTPFLDIVLLRRELEAFVNAPENRRDYMPDVACSVVGVHELNKIELRCSVAHRSNWANERLRAARSNKFYCALLAAVRRIPLNKPGGPLALGEEGRPMFTAPLDEAVAMRQMRESLAARRSQRMDFEEPSEEEEEKLSHQQQQQQAGAAPDPDKVREDREKRNKLKVEKAAAAEAERVALATLQKMPPPEKAGPSIGASSAIEINEFVGLSATGMRSKHSG